MLVYDGLLGGGTAAAAWYRKSVRECEVNNQEVLPVAVTKLQDVT